MYILHLNVFAMLLFKDCLPSALEFFNKILEFHSQCSLYVSVYFSLESIQNLEATLISFSLELFLEAKPFLSH